MSFLPGTVSEFFTRVGVKSNSGYWCFSQTPILVQMPYCRFEPISIIFPAMIAKVLYFEADIVL